MHASKCLCLCNVDAAQAQGVHVYRFFCAVSRRIAGKLCFYMAQ